MIILAFTDVHANIEIIRKMKPKAKKADLIICTGDFTVFEYNLKRVIKEIAAMGKKVLIIHGNHEDDEEVKKECERYDNMIFLHKHFHEEGDLLFCGYGGGGFAMRDREFEEFEHRIKEKADGKKLVMLFHMPPYKTKMDVVYGEHVGSKSYTDFIKRQKPILALCGHIHEGFGKHSKIGRTLVMNPGPHGRLIKVP